MIYASYEDLLNRVLQETGLQREDVEKRVRVKLDELSGLVSREGALLIVANDLGVKVLQDDYRLVPLDQLKPGMRDVTIQGKVLAVYEPRSFTRNEQEGRVQSLLLGEGSQRVRVSAWHTAIDKLATIKPGDIIRIKNAYTRQGLNGSVEVHVNERSSLEVNPEGVTITIEGGVQREATRKRLADVTKEDGMIDVFGTIVQVFDPYLFPACPECNKKLRETPEGLACDVHGVQEPQQRGILTVYVDDNSAALRAVFFHEQFKRLVPDEQLWQDSSKLKEDLLGSFIRLTARVRYNEAYDRIELIVQDATRDVNVDEELRKLEELEREAEDLAGEAGEA